MTDLFESKDIKPMLIGASGEAFDNPDYIYELKLDGVRCIAYLDPEEGTDLRSIRNVAVLPNLPELSNIHQHVDARCILDGELVVLADGKPDFSEIQRRSVFANDFKLNLQSSRPAAFIAFDILYYNGETITSLPLMKRKKILRSIVKENARISLARYIERRGIDFSRLAKKQGLESIVAKRKDSVYSLGKQSGDWIKIKTSQDEDFVICGYSEKDTDVVGIVLGQHREHSLVYKGSVPLNISSKDFELLREVPRMDSPPFEITPSGLDNTVWIKPILVCKVTFMTKMKTGYMRQPVFKGIRFDKNPEACIEPPT